MIFQRFEDEGLSQYSYAVGCDGTGAVAIVDPRRTVDAYLAFAEARGLRISHVLETHIHADFASGARELAERTGAELKLSAYDEGELYEVAFPHTPLTDGDAFELGAVRIEALHTPGHTPEHLSYLVYDGARSRETPMLMLSGDFLFVGSLGRPDLLGEEAKLALAGRLYDSVQQKLPGLPDGLEIHPGHGAGSMCGSGMGGRPQSTLGFERLANPYLESGLGRERFIEQILGNVPPFPDYYRRMKQLNSAGPAPTSKLPRLRPIEAEEFHRLAGSGHAVFDVRGVREFGAGHIPGSFGIGGGRLLSQWAAWTLPYETPLLVVAPDPETARAARQSLLRVGLDGLAGWLAGGIDAWRAAGYPLAELRQVNAYELQQRLVGGDNGRVLDVRSDGEWQAGHIAGALHVHAGLLEDRLDELPRDGGPLYVICASGYRSTIAASVLARHGFEGVVNVIDGMDGWSRGNLPVVRD